MVRATLPLSLLILAGCSKTPESKLAALLPEGHSGLAVTSKKGDDLEFHVGWARPGYPENKVSFAVLKAKDDVYVFCMPKLAEFQYSGGKLKSEKVIGATEAQWPWLQERAGLLAKIAYEVGG